VHAVHAVRAALSAPLLGLLAFVALFLPTLVMGTPDGIVLSVARGATPGDVALSWTGAPAGPCTVYRSKKYSPNAGIGNVVTTTIAT